MLSAPAMGTLGVILGQIVLKTIFLIFTLNFEL
jgi:hypothetical protein